MRVSLVIDGVPVPKGRHKHGMRGGRVVTWTPQKTVDYEAVVATAAKSVMAGRSPLEGPLWAKLQVFMPIPKSTSKKKRAEMLAGRIRPAKKPDFDNYAKAICDGMNAIVYRDDAQIVGASITKFYSDRPRVEVHIGNVDGAVAG